MQLKGPLFPAFSPCEGEKEQKASGKELHVLVSASDRRGSSPSPFQKGRGSGRGIFQLPRYELVCDHNEIREIAVPQSKFLHLASGIWYWNPHAARNQSGIRLYWLIAFLLFLLCVRRSQG